MRQHARLATAVVALTLLVTGCADTEPSEGPLEIPQSNFEQVCYSESGPVELLIGLNSMTNTDDKPVTLTGVELVGEGDWSLIEAAVVPIVYEAAGRRWGWFGTVYYPSDNPKWDGARRTIPGAVIDPGEELEFAYHIEVAPSTRIDHAEITYEDEAGDEYVEGDDISVVVVDENDRCSKS